MLHGSKTPSKSSKSRFATMGTMNVQNESFYVNLTDHLNLSQRIICFFAGCDKIHTVNIKWNYTLPVIT